MKNNATSYILNSISIIRNNFSPFLIILAASLIFFLPIIEKIPNVLYFLSTVVIMIIIYPSIFGQYSEITLHDQTIPYSVLFKRHWSNYLIVSLLLGTPSAVFVLLNLLFKIEINHLRVISSIIVSSLSIYVLPLVFIHGQKWEGIKVGFQCTLGNLLFNLPLFFIVSVTTVMGFFLEYPDKDASRLYYVIFYGLFMMLNLFIEFLVFISATLILKEKGLAKS